MLQLSLCTDIWPTGVGVGTDWSDRAQIHDRALGGIKSAVHMLQLANRNFLRSYGSKY